MLGRCLFFLQKSLLLLFSLLFLGEANVNAQQPESNRHRKTVDLEVTYKEVNITGHKRLAIAVNNQIPAPSLHFKEGDQVTINVHNRLNKGTTIHWHGLLVPWQMDGVEGISQKAIPPGGVFHYQFTLHQAGTYWYHAHKDTQEQEGLYGAFIVEPSRPSAYHYNRDYVVVLSDWSNTPGAQVFANLKKEGDYYAPGFPLQPSLVKFLSDYRKATSTERKELLADYQMMQQMRMSIYDLSDVAYDAYLMNGQTKTQPWHVLVKQGDRVRLRFIGAAGSTIYRIKIPGAKMQMVHVQGNDVKPYYLDDFSLAPGETADVLVSITHNRPYLIYAESLDTRGAAIGALLTHPKQRIDPQQITPFPEPKPVTRQMMKNMMGMDASEPHQGMKHGSGTMRHDLPATHTMAMPTEPTIIGDSPRAMSPSESAVKTFAIKYQHLKAAVPTNNPNKPVTEVIRMELFGYMDRFIWMINGLPEYKTKSILFAPGKRYRIIFTNNSMMRHPMHIHGHWFILRNGYGAYDPLLHTIEVPPGATAVADIDSDASGQWFFHCHHLYHMMAGMSRVFQYRTIIDVVNKQRKPQKFISSGNYGNRPIVRVDQQIPLIASLVHHPMAHHAGFYFANFLDIGADPANNAQRMTFKGLYGPDYHKLELFTNDAEMSKGRVDYADVDIFYWHLLNQFWALKGGVNYFNRPAYRPYWQPGIGIEGLMPYFIATDLRSYYYQGSVKLDLELSRDTQITNNFFLNLGVRGILATKTVKKAAVGSGLNQMRYMIKPYYRLMPGLNLTAEFEHEKAYGQFKNILRNLGKDFGQNTLTLGLSAIF